MYIFTGAVLAKPFRGAYTWKKKRYMVQYLVMIDVKKTINGIHNWYYPVVLSIYILALFLPDIMRPGVVSAVFVILTAAAVVFKELQNAGTGGDFSLTNIAGNSSTEDIIAFLWITFNLLSGIWCVSFGMPLSVYLGELFTTALPMCFYFCGRRDSSSHRFSVNFLVSVAVIGILGVVLFITGPKFYIDYLMRLELISKADVPTMRVRMHSVIGSTLMGFLPTVGMLLSVRCFIESREKRSRSISAASFILMLFLSFMSNQRSAMAAAIIIIIYLNILIFFVFNTADRRIFYGECIAIPVFAALFFFLFRDAFMKVYYRLVSLPGAIAQRSDQWVGAANNMKSIWLGNGLGANGHRAIGFTEHLIADGGLAKLYVESGIIGTSLFIFLILLILKRGFSRLKDTAPEVGIVLITLLMSVGSNMMSFALSVPVFYYYMGRISGICNGGEKT